MLIFRLIKVVAFLGILWGLLRIGTGVFVATQFPTDEAMQAASQRYLATATSGEAIDQGVLWALCALVVWMIAKIGQHVTAKGKRAS